MAYLFAILSGLAFVASSPFSANAAAIDRWNSTMEHVRTLREKGDARGARRSCLHALRKSTHLSRHERETSFELCLSLAGEEVDAIKEILTDTWGVASRRRPAGDMILKALIHAEHGRLHERLDESKQDTGRASLAFLHYRSALNLELAVADEPSSARRFEIGRSLYRLSRGNRRLHDLFASEDERIFDSWIAAASDHSEKIEASEAAAASARDQGAVLRAIILYEEALSARRALTALSDEAWKNAGSVRPYGHPDIGRIQRTLVSLYSRMGNFLRAERAGLDAVRIFEAWSIPTEIIVTLGLLSRMNEQWALTLHDLDRLERLFEAAKVSQIALTLAKDTWGADHPEFSFLLGQYEELTDSIARWTDPALQKNLARFREAEKGFLGTLR